MSLVIFDLDGTLVTGPKGGFANSVADQSFLPGVIEKCEELKQRGIRIAIATNQGGVPMGIVSEEATRARVDAAAQALGMDDYEMCMFHPQAKLEKYRLSILDCRKPSPYMLEQLMERLGATPEETTMVGDRIEDMTAASLAGVRFAWSVDFF